MTLAELRQALALLPAGSSLTLSRDELLRAIADAEPVGELPERIDTERAASMLGVTPKTVANWCAAGKFAGAQKTGSARGKWTIPRDAVRAAVTP